MADSFCLKDESPLTVGGVLMDIARRPHEYLVRLWHWKAAIFSSIIRSGIFFGANASAGVEAATGAAAAEFLYRVVASGFYGSLTQAFRKARPEWLANLTAALLLPALQHSIELAIHWLRGTPNLRLSIGASIVFTIFSTLFNLYSMRRGSLVVGQDAQPIWRDVWSFPSLLAGFALAGCRGLRRLARI